MFILRIKIFRYVQIFIDEEKSLRLPGINFPEFFTERLSLKDFHYKLLSFIITLILIQLTLLQIEYFFHLLVSQVKSLKIASVKYFRLEKTHIFSRINYLNLSCGTYSLQRIFSVYLIVQNFCKTPDRTNLTFYLKVILRRNK